MARKPNYNFERMERDRAKAAKLAAKAKAKNDEKALGSESADGADDEAQPEADPAA
ncbi:MAG: hypothetical protein Q7R40_03725 [Phaeospirillum sp.]|nr:hypothetical protein [Phaeospirillum sp.]